MMSFQGDIFNLDLIFQTFQLSTLVNDHHFIQEEKDDLFVAIPQKCTPVTTYQIFNCIFQFLKEFPEPDIIV